MKKACQKRMCPNVFENGKNSQNHNDSAAMVLVFALYKLEMPLLKEIDIEILNDGKYSKAVCYL